MKDKKTLVIIFLIAIIVCLLFPKFSDNKSAEQKNKIDSIELAEQKIRDTVIFYESKIKLLESKNSAIQEQKIYVKKRFVKSVKSIDTMSAVTRLIELRRIFKGDTIIRLGDTSIFLTTKQENFVINQDYMIDELTQLDALNNVLIAGKDSVISEQNKEIYVLKNLDSISQNEKQILKDQAKKLKKEVRRQKIMKTIAIIGGVALIILVAI